MINYIKHIDTFYISRAGDYISSHEIEATWNDYECMLTYKLKGFCKDKRRFENIRQAYEYIRLITNKI